MWLPALARLVAVAASAACRLSAHKCCSSLPTFSSVSSDFVMLPQRPRRARAGNLLYTCPQIMSDEDDEP
eukprot:3155761-Karenia_brevis.AAC.1